MASCLRGRDGVGLRPALVWWQPRDTILGAGVAKLPVCPGGADYVQGEAT